MACRACGCDCVDTVPSRVMEDAETVEIPPPPPLPRESGVRAYVDGPTNYVPSSWDPPPPDTVGDLVDRETEWLASNGRNYPW